jgi:hypothetical protein
MRLTISYWYRCHSCGDGLVSAKALANHHCFEAEPGADEHGHCTRCGTRMHRAHSCGSPQTELTRKPNTFELNGRRVHL